MENISILKNFKDFLKSKLKKERKKKEENGLKIDGEKSKIFKVELDSKKTYVLETRINY